VRLGEWLGATAQTVAVRLGRKGRRLTGAKLTALAEGRGKLIEKIGDAALKGQGSTPAMQRRPDLVKAYQASE
jgi:hypothetical protein